MRKVIFFTGFALVLLGALWLLQGLGIVHIRPVLCFSDCAPIEGKSATWAGIGAAVLTLGGACIFWSLQKRFK